MCINLLLPYKYVEAQIFSPHAPWRLHTWNREYRVTLFHKTHNFDQSLLSRHWHYTEVSDYDGFLYEALSHTEEWKSPAPQWETHMHMRETMHFDISAVSKRYLGESFCLIFFRWLRSCVHTIDKLQVFDVTKLGNGFTQGY